MSHLFPLRLVYWEERYVPRILTVRDDAYLVQEMAVRVGFLCEFR